MSANLSFLNKQIGLLDSSDFGDMEDVIWAPGNDTESVLSRIAQQLLFEVRHIKKEYEHYQLDPNYNYSGRIHRNAILSRNNQIHSLRKQLAASKAGSVAPLMPDLELGKAWAAQHNFVPVPRDHMFTWPDNFPVIFSALKRVYRSEDEIYRELGKWIKGCWDVLAVRS